MVELRPYQVEAVEAVRNLLRQGHRKVLMVAPTGSGKTRVGADILNRAAAKGSRSLFLVHRRELVKQTSDKLTEIGVQHGIIAAGFRPHAAAPVQVAMIQSLVRRDMPNSVDLIIIDETHRVTTKNTYQKILDQYPEAAVLGLTATPWRLDGKGLSDIFEAHHIVATPAELRDQGYLVPIRGQVYTSIDTSDVRTVKGDFSIQDLAQSEENGNVIGDVVAEWLAHARGRSTIAFGYSVHHSQTIVRAFLDHGITAEHLDGETPMSERDAILQRFWERKTMVLSNCQIATEGVDLPFVSCVVLARPTLSESLYLQMVGRGSRPFEGKQDCLIHDHAGCLLRHGHPYSERDFSPAKTRTRRKKVTEERYCEKCGTLLSEGDRRCPQCGFMVQTEMGLNDPRSGPGHRDAKGVLQVEAFENYAAPKRDKRDKREWPVDERRDAWKARSYEDKKKFYIRMVEKHGLQKASRVYRWTSGDLEWPSRRWAAELSSPPDGEFSF